MTFSPKPTGNSIWLLLKRRFLKGDDISLLSFLQRCLFLRWRVYKIWLYCALSSGQRSATYAHYPSSFHFLVCFLTYGCPNIEITFYFFDSFIDNHLRILLALVLHIGLGTVCSLEDVYFVDGWSQKHFIFYLAEGKPPHLIACRLSLEFIIGLSPAIYADYHIVLLILTFRTSDHSKKPVIKVSH